MIGLACLLVVSLAATAALPPAEVKDILLVVVEALAVNLKDLLSDGRQTCST